MTDTPKTDPSRNRKDEHLDLCMEGDVAFRRRTTLLEEVEPVHDALPDLAFDDVDPSVALFGRRLQSPLLIAAMTGGTERAARINRDLAAAAQACGVGFALGSQRRLLQKGITLGFQVRDVAPDALILGNIGLVQAREASSAALADMVAASGVDALCVHLNPAMEIIQPGGDRDFRQGVDTLQRLVAELPVPVMVKETGSGLSRAVGQRIAATGVRVVDTSGAGGTSWVGVETLRARGAIAEVGRTFWDWGVPTAASVVQLDGLGLEVVATGGLSTGMDALRALALGARATGFARHLLQTWAEHGRNGLEERIRQLAEEIRVGLFLCGCRTVDDLHRAPLVLGPRLLRWVPPDAPLRARLLDGGAP